MSTSQSRVVLNGDHLEYFTHQLGLRQGDPISPMLFIIAVDVFQIMVVLANSLLKEPLSKRCPNSIIALQYADDTAIIANAGLETLTTLKIILRCFAQISGLTINYEKSSFVTFNLDRMEKWRARVVLMFKQESLPVQYLGMLLTISRPNRKEFLPLIERLEKRMEGWKGKLISRGGRLQLVKSVLTAIPIYYMMCLKLPKWVIDRIDAVRRAFLWGRNGKEGRAISLLNWPTVCMPTVVGGMGIHDLEVHNTALLLCWWRRAYAKEDCLWTVTITALKSTGNYSNGPKFWLVEGSFFWRALLKLLPNFRWSTSWEIGDGTSISFWLDAWHDQSLVTTLEQGQKPTQPKISLRDAVPITQLLLPDYELTIQLRLGRDKICWNWTAGGIYTAKSVYKLLKTGSREGCQTRYVWKLPVPTMVRIFA